MFALALASSLAAGTADLTLDELACRLEQTTRTPFLVPDAASEILVDVSAADWTVKGAPLLVQFARRVRAPDGAALQLSWSWTNQPQVTVYVNYKSDPANFRAPRCTPRVS
ncbi:hypothetical protein [Roseiterribacter gracilis]|uniref:Uncharacterized protein n=1 Tax=Roseiterribacter gracilis TaxID=2812848 RepID=A0A8S8XC38_9PROT|nr:hypothetical protein TMPK1_16380 [Rhodospirillales bacterium TMPK1]